MFTMNQPISNKRKFFCAFSGICVIVFALFLAFGEISDASPQREMDCALVVIAVILAIIHLCDILSVFTEGFRSKLEAVERKISFIPVIEVVVLVISVGGLFVGAGSLVLMLFVIGLMGGAVVLAILGIIAVALVITINMIAIIKTKMFIIKNKNNPAEFYPQQGYPQQGYPQQAYPNQQYSGLDSLGALGDQSSYDSFSGPGNL